ncbi:phytoene dehydrogenase-like protein [Arthrobacter sp. B3I9]|uniref:FAD-dependent monooxygenase n=1 Tax=Arthrobacter sp. B3I9 TaxID=3042270 RepID=UPI00278D87A4|nr:FAD-dependent monooxygenase [Arthrobacter sp. B3I9]MDQ0849359.1 phytoene dehydrogenase-like protein [Arthrobacter sp. B3I9]
MREQQDVVVIGGGQAGLAMSSVLQRRGREHVVLERRRIGERWRAERWDSLRFQRARIPELAHDVPPSVLQIDPTRYRSRAPNFRLPQS